MRTLAITLLLLLCCAPAPAETEPTLFAADVVEPALLAGPHFRVLPKAQLRALQAHFQIETDWGSLPADSVEMLGIRISEMTALELAYSESVTKTLSEAGFDVFQRNYHASATLAQHPVQAARNAPKGVLRYFSERWNRWAERLRKFGYRIDTALSEDGSPWHADGPMDDRRGPEPPEPWWDKPVDEIGRFIRSQTGHGRARRELAAELGVPSWTSNPLLRKRLDAMAWTVAAGRFASDKLIAAISSGAASALGQIRQVQHLTLEADPYDQRRQAEKRLERWTADTNLRFHLTWRSAFPPPLLIELLDLLEQLDPAQGAEAFLETARMADSELEARFVLNVLRLLIHCADLDTRGGRFEPIGALVLYRAADGSLLLPLPVDRLSWTSAVQRWMRRTERFSAPQKRVLLSGSLSEKATAEFRERGWSVRSTLQFPGAPPFAR